MSVGSPALQVPSHPRIGSQAQGGLCFEEHQDQSRTSLRIKQQQMDIEVVLAALM